MSNLKKLNMETKTHHSIGAIINGTTDYPLKNVPVWMSIDERYPVGAIIALTAGTVIPAGTPVKIDALGGTATALTSGEAESGECVGFTENDAYSDAEGSAFVDIVTKGRLLIDRAPEDAAAFAGKVPGVTFVKEAAE